MSEEKKQMPEPAPPEEPTEETAAEQPPFDEHQVYLNVLDACEEAKKKRNSYKKYGPLVVIITGIVFLALMFTLDRKIEFLILWVVTDLYTVALMVRAEYRYHQFKEILGIVRPEEENVEEEAQP